MYKTATVLYNKRSYSNIERIDMNQALLEFIHLIDAGEDYEKTLEFLSCRFSIPSEELEQAYNDYVMSL